MECTCVKCGKKMIVAHKTSVCPDCKFNKCVVCGKVFEDKWPYNVKTCSPECRGKYRAQSGIAKRGAEKARETLKIKYGVSSASALQTFEPRKCAWCGKIFTPRGNSHKYCDDIHYGPCPVCGKPTEIKDMTIGPQCCSEECRQKKIAATCLEKYGSKTAVNSEHARSLAKAHFLEKYGVDHYSKTPEYRAKYEATCLERFGTTSPLKNVDIKAKLLATNNERYGGNGPTCSEEVMQKVRDTAFRNHGGLGTASADILAKIESTNLAKYGSTRATASPDVQAKIIATCMKKYGVRNWFQSRERMEALVVDPTKLDIWNEFKADPIAYLNAYHAGKINIHILCDELGVSDTPIYSALVEVGCSGFAHSKMSKMESDVLRFLKPYQLNTVHNTRRVITPYELDIYLPDFNLGIECNPTITHNSSFADPWGDVPKPPSYHKKKSEAATAKGVSIFHVFSYEWVYQRNIVESMILSRLGLTKVKIYARNTELIDVSDAECKQFLEENHLKGGGNFPIRYGLRDKTSGTLVSLMTFNKMRKTIGVQEDCYELSRFCNLAYTTVVGGASKLFKHFITCHPEVNCIVSYSDIAHTSGNLYGKLGFVEEVHSGPNYVWVDKSTDKAVNRLNTQKQNLCKFLKDDSIDLSKTEAEIMMDHGYAQVYDCGTIRWRWNRPENLK